jgi:hypothetical protein
LVFVRLLSQGRSGIHGLIAAFGPKEPLIIGVEGEESIIREPIIVTPSEMTRMHISCARDIPLNRLKLYLRKYPNSPLLALLTRIPKKF